MFDKEITFDRFIRGLILVLGVVAGIWLLNRLSAVLLPFFVAWLLAYMLYPLVRFLQYRVRVPGRFLSIVVAIVLVLGVITGLVALIVPPTIKEFSRLSKKGMDEILSTPAKVAAEFVQAHPNITLALKGHRTYIAHGEEIYENIAGNSGMAKGGSGDVLAGVIASLTAQGADPYEAEVLGVHIHALAGDLAAAKLSRTAMLPSDIIDALPEIYTKIEDSIN
jgi:predicted PurR-regulated permease PerM